MANLFSFVSFVKLRKSVSVVSIFLVVCFLTIVLNGQTDPRNSVSSVKSDEVNNVALTVRPRMVKKAALETNSSTAEKTTLKTTPTISKKPIVTDVVTPKTIGDLSLNLEQLIFFEINQKRAEQGLAALIWDEDVAKVARLHSNNMAKYNFFSHTGLDGLRCDSRARALGVTKWHAIGENIAYNRGFQAPDLTAVKGWINSESHRTNLLSKVWTKTGIGVVGTSDGTYYLTQVFIDK